MKQIKPRRELARTAQSGASAIEFALIFPIMLAVGYAGLVYSYVYLLQQSIDFAAQQAAQAAVSVVPTSNSAADLSKRTTLANSVLTSTLNWLPGDQAGRIATTVPANCPGSPTPVSNTFVYQVNFALSGGTNSVSGNANQALFPSLINLPMGLGTIPPLPANLTACAVAFT